MTFVPGNIDARALREAFGCFMTGVTVVTCIDPDGAPLGFTANSFSSVSLDPPLLLVSIAKTSANLGAFLGGPSFAVNVLAEQQTEISNRFARPSQNRFSNIYWRNGQTGAPILAEVSAWFDCALHQTVDAGDHVILVGRVLSFAASVAPGLGYYRGGYIQPSKTATNLPMRPEVRVCAIIESGEDILMVDGGRGDVALPMAAVGEHGVQKALAKLITTHGGKAEIGPVYAVYEDDQNKDQILAIRCPAETNLSTKGAFVPLNEATLEDLSDPAQRAMLERLMQEKQDGIFGVYFGDHRSGRVTKPQYKEAAV